MVLMSYAMALVLVILAVLHIIWGMGFNWPRKSEVELVNSVAGFKGADKMPPAAASFFVGLMLFITAGLALGLDVTQFPRLQEIGSFGAAAAFIARGLIGYTHFWANLTPEYPFRRLDRRYYSPLCIALGMGFLMLAISRVGCCI